MRVDVRSGLRRLMIGWSAVMLAACDPADASEPMLDDDPTAAGEPAHNGWSDPLPLVEGEAWRSADAQDDPLGHERPPQVACPSAAWGPELGGLEIETGACNYFFAVQPSLAAIEAGDAIDVVVFHDRLDAAEPAEGHLAILLDDVVVWEEHVEIPAQANVLEARVVAERAWPAGTPVGLHLHNHGYNAWTVLEVSTAAAR